MKVLLIFPPQKHPASTGPVEMLLEEAGSFPPLGLLHIATPVAREGRHEIKIIDSILEDYSYEDIEKLIRTEKPDAVGITWNTEYLRDGYLVAKTVKKADPKIKVIVGGPHVYIFPLETIALPEVDYAVRGEADLVFSKMLDLLEENKSLEGMQGVIIKNKKYTALPLALVENPELLPIPNRRLVKYEKYSSMITRSSPITTIMSSRGCCFKCPFCPAGGTKIRENSVNDVLKEIEDCLSLGIKDILFFDELFTFNKKRVKEICNAIIAKKLKFKWHIRARIQTMDKEMIELLAKAGCNLIQFGIETGTERMQKVLGKNIPLETIREVIKMVRNTGILTYGNFMIASPSETKDEIRRTLDFAKELNLDFAIFSVTRLLPGTNFYYDAVKEGTVDDFWQKYAADPMYDIPSTYCRKDFTQKELKQIAYDLYKSFYLRPKYFYNYLMRVASFGNFFKHFAAGVKFFVRLLSKKENG